MCAISYLQPLAGSTNFLKATSFEFLCCGKLCDEISMHPIVICYRLFLMVSNIHTSGVNY